MNNNKVVLGNQTIMDISDSTVTPNNLLNGEIGYSGNGDRVVGSYTPSTAGHTIQNDSGTDMAQRSDLQFKGVYVEDNQANDVTKVDIVREFQSKSAIEALTGEEAKGFQYLDDDVYDAFTASEIGFDKTGTSYLSNNVDGVLRELDKLNTFDLLCEATAPATKYNLSASIQNYKKLVATIYFVSGTRTFFLGSTIVPVSDITVAGADTILCCINDGTVRKGQIAFASNTSVNTGVENTGWLNITKMKLWGLN